MKNYLIFSIVLLLATGNQLNAQKSQVLDQVVAVVDDEIILLSELQQQALSFAIQYGINPKTQPDQFNQLMSQVLDNLVVQKVLYVKALEDTLTVEDRIVNEELDRNIDRMVQQFGSREKVAEYYGASIEKIKRNFTEETRQGLLAKMVMGQKEAT
ncbi:SurA N-terminal domain-containing protein, partial [candidate division KSB1 bacterium]|nr:SurA N-terminal domain-containing protein [candidate division KSB1 bacterium]